MKELADLGVIVTTSQLLPGLFRIENQSDHRLDVMFGDNGFRVAPHGWVEPFGHCDPRLIRVSQPVAREAR